MKNKNKIKSLKINKQVHSLDIKMNKNDQIITMAMILAGIKSNNKKMKIVFMLAKNATTEPKTSVSMPPSFKSLLHP